MKDLKPVARLEAQIDQEVLYAFRKQISARGLKIRKALEEALTAWTYEANGPDPLPVTAKSRISGHKRACQKRVSTKVNAR